MASSTSDRASSSLPTLSRTIARLRYGRASFGSSPMASPKSAIDSSRRPSSARAIPRAANSGADVGDVLLRPGRSEVGRSGISFGAVVAAPGTGSNASSLRGGSDMRWGRRPVEGTVHPAARASRAAAVPMRENFTVASPRKASWHSRGSRIPGAGVEVKKNRPRRTEPSIRVERPSRSPPMTEKKEAATAYPPPAG